MPDDLWLFAYGSLMWNPGFAYAERRVAWLKGFHRAFCIYSWHYRGTKERPGLVLGLDRGGTCRGIAFRLAPEGREAVLEKVRARELLGGVYRERVVPLRFSPRGEARTRAIAYVAERANPQYAGRIPPDAQARLIAQGRGVAGDNRAYLSATAEHLAELGMGCARLEALRAAIARLDAIAPPSEDLQLQRE